MAYKFSQFRISADISGEFFAELLELTSVDLSHSFRVSVIGVTSPSRFATLASKLSANEADSLECSDVNKRARFRSVVERIVSAQAKNCQ